jgi:hypothetical protein
MKGLRTAAVLMLIYGLFLYCANLFKYFNFIGGRDFDLSNDLVVLTLDIVSWVAGMSYMLSAVEMLQLRKEGRIWGIFASILIVSICLSTLLEVTTSNFGKMSWLAVLIMSAFALLYWSPAIAFLVFLSRIKVKKALK